jgi:hypothetical protein
VERTVLARARSAAFSGMPKKQNKSKCIKHKRISLFFPIITIFSRQANP